MRILSATCWMEMEDKGIKGYAEKQSFIKEHASQLVKALIPQN